MLDIELSGLVGLEIKARATRLRPRRTELIARPELLGIPVA